MATTGIFGATAGPRAGSVRAALLWATGWVGRVYRARQLLHQLDGMDEHELRDIGLTRLDLQAVRALPIDVDPSMALRRHAEERRRWRRAQAVAQPH